MEDQSHIKDQIHQRWKLKIELSMIDIKDESHQNRN